MMTTSNQHNQQWSHTSTNTSMHSLLCGIKQVQHPRMWYCETWRMTWRWCSVPGCQGGRVASPNGSRFCPVGFLEYSWFLSSTSNMIDHNCLGMMGHLYIMCLFGHQPCSCSGLKLQPLEFLHSWSLPACKSQGLRQTSCHRQQRPSCSLYPIIKMSCLWQVVLYIQLFM